MRKQKGKLETVLAFVIILSLGLAACGSSPTPEVVEKVAVRDTPIPPTQTPLPTDTPAPMPPTDTPVPPTDTPVPPTDTLTPAPPVLLTEPLSVPPGMVYVPAGEFTMGATDAEIDSALALCNEFSGVCSRHWFENAQPQHTVYLDASYIDRTEVTNAQYRECVEAEVCDTPGKTAHYDNADYAQHPVVYASWNDADAYCRWVGKRLPTEAEWEKAARGTDGRVYPWGNSFDGSKLNFCDENCTYDHKDPSVDDGYKTTAPVGSYPAGTSPYGVLDMAGNACEWVADWYGEDYYSQSPERNPPGPDSGEWRVLRGGSWLDYLWNARCASRLRYLPRLRYSYVGFRCARGSE
ncbi:MAG: formylglycine-generating enzyme family protein [Anaerolineae bacterium]